MFHPANALLTGESKCLVEFAPYQRLPRTRKPKDSRVNTIEDGSVCVCVCVRAR